MITASCMKIIFKWKLVENEIEKFDVMCTILINLRWIEVSFIDRMRNNLIENVKYAIEIHTKNICDENIEKDRIKSKKRFRWILFQCYYDIVCNGYFITASIYQRYNDIVFIWTHCCIRESWLTRCRIFSHYRQSLQTIIRSEIQLMKHRSAWRKKTHISVLMQWSQRISKLQINFLRWITSCILNMHLSKIILRKQSLNVFWFVASATNAVQCFAARAEVEILAKSADTTLVSVRHISKMQMIFIS